MEVSMCIAILLPKEARGDGSPQSWCLCAKKWIIYFSSRVYVLLTIEQQFSASKKPSLNVGIMSKEGPSYTSPTLS